MQNLIETIANYKRATQNLIEKTNDYEEFIKNNTPFELWKRFGIYKFGSGQSEGRHISISGKAIPGSTDKFGKCFYWGGDFNYYTEYVSGRELVNWCKQLPALIAEATEHIDTLIKNADSISLQITTTN